MALKSITCQSALHASRKNIKDGREYRDVMGTYDGEIPPPVKCERCAYHDAASAPVPPSPDDIIAKLSAATGVTPAELRALMKL